MKQILDILLNFGVPVILIILLVWRFLFLDYKSMNDNLKEILIHFIVLISSIVIGGLILFLIHSPIFLGVGLSIKDIEENMVLIILCVYAVIFFVIFIIAFSFVGRIIYVAVFLPSYNIYSISFDKIDKKIKWKQFFAKYSKWFHFRFYAFSFYEEHNNLWFLTMLFIAPLILVMISTWVFFPDIYKALVNSGVFLLKIRIIPEIPQIFLYPLVILVGISYLIILYHCWNLLKCFFESIISPHASLYYYRAIDNYEKGNYQIADAYYQRLKEFYPHSTAVEIYSGTVKVEQFYGIKNSLCDIKIEQIEANIKAAKKESD